MYEMKLAVLQKQVILTQCLSAALVYDKSIFHEAKSMYKPRESWRSSTYCGCASNAFQSPGKEM